MTFKTGKVCVIGSGNFGSTVARLAASNSLNKGETVRMWVFEEQINGRNLTEIINKDHENVKYLPGISLPENLVAVPSLEETVRGAEQVIFCVPHQFLPGILRTIAPCISPTAVAISCIKGFHIGKDANASPTVTLFSQQIAGALGIPCGAMIGANIASEIAAGLPAETTIAGDVADFVQILRRPNFRVTHISDICGLEACGALKNVVAILAGIVDGLELGNNAKAAIIRMGLIEMMEFCKRFFDGVEDSTFFESGGLADLVTTCYGGRNRKCGEAYARTGKSFAVLEKELLNGQKLQGTLTAEEVYEFLSGHGGVIDFPIFHAVYDLCFNDLAPRAAIDRVFEHRPMSARL